MKKFLCVVISICLVALSLCACKSDADTTSVKTATSSSNSCVEQSKDDVASAIVSVETQTDVSSESETSVEQTTSSKKEVSSSSVSSENSVSSKVSTSSKTKVSSNVSTSKVESSSQVKTSSSNVSSKIDPKDCYHSYDDGKIITTAKLFEAGEKEYTCTKCGDSYTNTYPVEKIKILAIGNSFSLNTMWNLYDICSAAGVKDIDIAIMYIAGCSLDKHWENAQTNSNEYDLYRNNNGKWVKTPKYTLDAILQEDWEIISLQNRSEDAGDDTKFSNLDNMLDYVTGKCPDATVLWHMTWAYTNSSKYMSSQHIYNYDENTMYQKIVECTQNIIAKNTRIHSIVPMGTAVMNARTSRLKNNVHNKDDGSHLSEDVGYYVGAITWFIHLTGLSPYDFNYKISAANINQNIDVFVECAENAIKNPYKITQSYYSN